MGEHPLLRALASVDAAIDDMAGLDPAFLPTREKERALLTVQRELARLDGLRMELLAAAGDVADDNVARSAGAWLAAEARSGARQGVRDQRLAEGLDRWPDIRTALRAGVLGSAQAEVIVHALGALPDDLDDELVAQAAAQLVRDAGHFEPHELRVLGRRVLEVIAPDAADAHEEQLLRAEERHGRGETRVTFRPRGDGVTDVIARVPDHVADRLRVYLDSFTAPRRSHLDDRGPGDVDLLSLPRRRGEAFCALLEHVPSDRLPVHGGTPTSVVVTLDLESLQRGVGVAEVSTGGALTATEVRRLACTAHILPAVLGGAGQILDLGRSRRLFSAGQRKALAVRDRRCRAEACAIPAAWCEAHHAGAPWSRGGRTDWATGCCCARSTTTGRTTRSGPRRGCPTATFATAGGRDPVGDTTPGGRDPAQLEVRSMLQDFLASAEMLSAALLTSLLLRAWSLGASAWSFERSTPWGTWPFCIEARSLGLRPACFRAFSIVVMASSRVFQSPATLDGASFARECTLANTWSRLSRPELLPLRLSK